MVAAFITAAPRTITINSATIPPQPNFQTREESHKLDGTALEAISGLQAVG